MAVFPVRQRLRSHWMDSEELNEKNLDQILHKVDGMLVPGGFGNRGTEGMILAASVCKSTQDSVSGYLPRHADGNCGICQSCARI